MASTGVTLPAVGVVAGTPAGGRVDGRNDRQRSGRAGLGGGVLDRRGGDRAPHEQGPERGQPAAGGLGGPAGRIRGLVVGLRRDLVGHGGLVDGASGGGVGLGRGLLGLVRSPLAARDSARAVLSAARWSAARPRSSMRRSLASARTSARSARSSGAPRRSAARLSWRAPSSADANGAALCALPVPEARGAGAAGRTAGRAVVTGVFIGRPPPWSGRCARSSASRSRAGCRRSGSPCRGRRCRRPARGRWTRTAW